MLLQQLFSLVVLFLYLLLNSDVFLRNGKHTGEIIVVFKIVSNEVRIINENIITVSWPVTLPLHAAG